jgi:hypothetical protein
MVDNIIVVGNGESVLESKAGDIIDNFKTVVRLGRYVTEGFEEYVGSKTDIISTIYWKLDIDRLKNHKVILSVPLNYQEDFLKGEKFITKEFSDYKKNIIHLNTFNDIAGIKDMYLSTMPPLKDIDTVNFSLGFKTFYFLLKLFPGTKLYATGFDFFKTGWYWDPSHNRNDSNLHPYIWERLWYKKMVRNGRINEI